MEAYISSLEVKLGSVITSNLTERKYKISKLTEERAVLDSLDGSSHVITELDSLRLFYRPSDERKA
jgi:hypothetical protein